jgi:transposase InsO family protein
VETTAILFAQAYVLARERAAQHSFTLVRLMAQRDQAIIETRLLRRELEVLRRNRQRLPPARRPPYAPADRFEILQLRRLRGWSIQQTADRFVLHRNTVWDWCRAFHSDRHIGLFFGAPPFHQLHEAVHWLVHEIRALCPEKEFGTRAIALRIVQAGIQISRSSVQRILRTAKPHRPVTDDSFRATCRRPRHLLRPTQPNRVWHLDLTHWQVLWVRFCLAALLDGYSRKLLALKIYARAPTSAHLLRLVRRASDGHGPPRFLITDHGCQFRQKFRAALRRHGVTLVKGRVRSACFNGKVERFFRTLKLWLRLSLLGLKTDALQRRLDVYRHWYNTARPMTILNGRTPDQVYTGQPPPKPVPIRARDPVPNLRVVKRHHGGDPYLPLIEIACDQPWRQAA